VNLLIDKVMIWVGNELKAYFVWLGRDFGRDWALSKNWEGSLGDLIGLTAKNVGG